MIAEMGDKRLVWTSFAMLDQAIDVALQDPKGVVSEREEYLLRELQAMLDDEGLIAARNDVVIVAARIAWPEYNEYSAYVCQAGRSFRRAERIGFYSRGQIYPLVPKIPFRKRSAFKQTENGSKNFRKAALRGDPGAGVPDAYDGELGRVVDRMLADGRRSEGQRLQVILLSAPDSSDTLRLRKPIRNDKESESGRVTAFTMGQRYVRSGDLEKAETTSELG